MNSTELAISDKSWVRQSFLLPDYAISNADKQHRSYSGAENKFTDTTLGGNFSINNPPQPTRFADIKDYGIYRNSKGMGRAYSEAIDDNARRVHFRFGVREYNSMASFFSNFYDSRAGRLARTGEAGSFFFNVGQAIGFVVSVPLLPFVYASRFMRFITNKPYSKYYYLKPTMPLYWNAVNTMANMVATNMGLLPSVWGDGFETTQMDDASSVSNAVISKASADATGGSSKDKIDWETMNKILPDVFRSDGGIDIYAVANRAQRLNDRYIRTMKEVMENSSSEEDLVANLNNLRESIASVSTRGRSLNDYLDSYLNSGLAKGASEQEIADGGAIGNWEDSWTDYFSAGLRDGNEWVSFKLDEIGDIGESFSNSTKESELAETINGISQAAAEKKNSFMNLNLSDGPVGGAIETVLGAVGDIAEGTLSGLGLSGVMALGGGAFADIPKIYANSSADLPSETYTIQLRTPYGNKMSVYMNLYVPLCMLLAGVLPISTGKQSYTSPFLCEMYSQGRSQVRLGMIESLQITRGTSNIGWTVDKLAHGIDVTFNVVDMSSVMHMPLGDGMGMLDDDSAFMDYMAVLGSLGMTSQIYPMEKLKRRLQYTYQDFKTWSSPAHMANWASGTFTGRALSAFQRTAARMT